MSKRPTRRAKPRRPGRNAGFSLIEVLIALLLLAIGLLGLAFLQVINVRYTSSAEHRTIATNLATEVLDMMRSNPRHVLVYQRLTEASFAGYVPPVEGCASVGENVAEPLNNLDRWRCHVVARLPAGTGSVVVNGNDVDGYNAIVTVAWTDDVGYEDGGASGTPQATTTFQVTSLL